RGGRGRVAEAGAEVAARWEPYGREVEQGDRHEQARVRRSHHHRRLHPLPVRRGGPGVDGTGDRLLHQEALLGRDVDRLRLPEQVAPALRRATPEARGGGGGWDGERDLWWERGEPGTTRSVELDGSARRPAPEERRRPVLGRALQRPVPEGRRRAAQGHVGLRGSTRRLRWRTPSFTPARSARRPAGSPSRS